MSVQCILLQLFRFILSLAKVFQKTISVDFWSKILLHYTEWSKKSDTLVSNLW